MNLESSSLHLCNLHTLYSNGVSAAQVTDEGPQDDISPCKESDISRPAESDDVSGGLPSDDSEMEQSIEGAMPLHLHTIVSSQVFSRIGRLQQG